MRLRREVEQHPRAEAPGVFSHACAAALVAVVAIIPITLLSQITAEPTPMSAVPAPAATKAAPQWSTPPEQPTSPTLGTDDGSLVQPGLGDDRGGVRGDDVDPVEINHEDTSVMVVTRATNLAPGTISKVTRPGKGILAYPVVGPVTSNYGMRFHPVLGYVKLHTGTDFGTGCGRAVGASAAGTVSFVGWGGGNGNRIVIDHGLVEGKRLETTYNHLSAFAVRPGQKVVQGQGIALTGTTGYSTGCHLHFEVMVDGNFVDPLPWLSGEASPKNPIPDSLLVTSGPSDSSTPTPSATPSADPSSQTPSGTPSSSESGTPSVSPSPGTPSQSHTPTPGTPTPSTSTPSPTTPSQTPTPSTTPTATPSQTPTPTPTPTPTQEPSDPAPTETVTPTQPAQPSEPPPPEQSTIAPASVDPTVSQQPPAPSASEPAPSN
ncbi:M23 family metallopeptidase [Aestuariimicrobium ganziense]|uniref:M23 family metallopeptidase n=1 Tax=Aestuariimicrobium ganziense TaxID=2773677 RepID=UPI001944769D|nr:M23 family metallopeptidase [Aestuariimicrobium ganziense]